MKRIFRILLIFMVLTILISLSSCIGIFNGSETSLNSQSTNSSINYSSFDKVNLKLTYWGSSMEQAAIENAIISFEKKYNNITVEAIHFPKIDFLVKLNARIASGEEPDISYSSAWKLKMGEEGLIYNFYDLLDEDPIAKKEDWIETCWWNWAADKSAGPIMANVTPSLMYNVDLFLEAGLDLPPIEVKNAWSWQEFLEVARKLTIDSKGRTALDDGFDKDNIVQFGVMFSGLWSSYMPFVYSNGGDFLSEDRESLGLADKKAAEAIQRIADLINVYHVHPTLIQKNSLPTPAIAIKSKKIAMYIDGSWNHLDLSEVDANWGVGVLPIDNNYTTFFYGGSLIIFKSTHHLNETWELYKWITDPNTTLPMFQSIWMPVQTEWYTNPSLVDSWASESLPSRPKGFQDAVMRSTFEHQVRNPELDVINFNEINDTVDSYLNQVWLGEKTAEEAMSEAKKVVAPLIEGTYFND